LRQRRQTRKAEKRFEENLQQGYFKIVYK
jgi:hypothetical protein